MPSSYSLFFPAAFALAQRFRAASAILALAGLLIFRFRTFLTLGADAPGVATATVSPRIDSRSRVRFSIRALRAAARLSALEESALIEWLMAIHR